MVTIRAATAPVGEVKDFLRALRVAGLPRPLRRRLWWLGLNVCRQRADYFGTFAVTAYPALGAESLHPQSPLTATLTYGLIGADGRADVRLAYDHRVLDGGPWPEHWRGWSKCSTPKSRPRSAVTAKIWAVAHRSA
jgi:hypothetical protein